LKIIRAFLAVTSLSYIYTEYSALHEKDAFSLNRYDNVAETTKFR